MDSSKDQGAGKSQNAGTGTGVCIEVQRSKKDACGKDPKDEVQKIAVQENLKIEVHGKM